MSTSPLRRRCRETRPSAAMSAVRLLTWLCMLGAPACAKQVHTANRAQFAPTRHAPVRVETTSPEPASVLPDRLPDAEPQTTPGEPLPAQPRRDGAYPVQLFAPFNELLAGRDADPFEGQTFHVALAEDEKPIDVASCDVLLKLSITDTSEVWLEPSTESEHQAFWSTAVGCLARDLLRGALPAERSRIAPLLANKDPSGLLPPQLGMIDFDDEREGAKAAAARCQSWKSYDRKVLITRKSPARFAIRADDWTGDLELYARGDIDGDGDEDVLVRRDGGVDGGSYWSTALFVLSQTERDPCIRVVREFGTF
jgi:hypothetical protein